MSRERPVNVAASVRQRLLDLARRQNLRMQDVLVRFATERLLYRLAQSPHRDAYVLKGAMLFTVWTGILPRATKDADLLGFGDPSPDRIARIFRELAADARSEDGLVFDAASVLVRAIREDSEYGGQRVTLAAELDGARMRVQVDVGFGDAVEPGPVEVVLPTLLDLPPARLMAYPVEVSVAEKFEAVVRLGLVNGRLKDYFDLWYIATRLPPDPRRLADAVRAMPRTWVVEVARLGGFTLVLRHQLYPLSHRGLALEVRTTLGLPVDAPRALYDGTMQRFVNWHNARRSIGRGEDEAGA